MTRTSHRGPGRSLQFTTEEFIPLNHAKLHPLHSSIEYDHVNPLFPAHDLYNLGEAARTRRSAPQAKRIQGFGLSLGSLRPPTSSTDALPHRAGSRNHTARTNVNVVDARGDARAEGFERRWLRQFTEPRSLSGSCGCRRAMHTVDGLARAARNRCQQRRRCVDSSPCGSPDLQMND